MLWGFILTGGGGKPEPTKEPEAAPAPQPEKKEPPEDKKVLCNHVPRLFKKPRSDSLIPNYVRVSV